MPQRWVVVTAVTPTRGSAAGDGVRTVLVESLDFAGDLMVKLAGHDMLKKMGVTPIAPSGTRSS